MQRLFAGDIQVRLKWVIRYWRYCAYGRDICPIKLHTRYMRGFDLTPYFVPGNAALDLTMIVHGDTKNKQGDSSDGERPEPSPNKKHNNAQEDPCQEDGQAKP